MAHGQGGAEITQGHAPSLTCNHEAPIVAHSIAPSITSNPYGDHEAREGLLVAHSLRGEGFDASEDGTGRGTPIVPVVAGTLSVNSGPNGHDAGNFASNQGVDAGYIVPVAPPIASTLTRGAESSGKGGYAGRRQEDESNLVAEPMVLMERGRDGTQSLEYRQDGTANAILTPNGGRGGFGVGAIAHAIQAGALRENPDAGPDGIGVQEGVSYTLEARAEVQAVSFQATHDAAGTMKSCAQSGGFSNSIDHAAAGYMAIEPTTWAVRRLTPTECERLQGVPDGFTQIPWRGKEAENCPDGPRYKALGNSMAVNVMALIGERINAVQNLIDEGKI